MQELTEALALVSPGHYEFAEEAHLVADLRALIDEALRLSGSEESE